MKGYNKWSYSPYRPPLYDTGDIYVCRIAPEKNAIHLEWLRDEGENYSVYVRVRGEGEFLLAGAASEGEFDITGLSEGTDYEFYVKSGEKKSRIRLARCGECVGTVVNYLHPDDEAYGFSGRYLCSPSLVRHPDGHLLASMDLFKSGAPQNLTLVFRSDDNGESWHYSCELMPCFWGKMFVHKGLLYMLSVNTEYGDLLIGRSLDGGRSFEAPVTLLRGAGGKAGSSGVHKNPQNVLSYNGRIYNSLEWGAWANKEYGHAAMVMSCDEDADLLIPENWSFTEPKAFNPDECRELPGLPKANMTIEGTVAQAPSGNLYDIMRFGNDKGKALAYRVNLENPEAPLEYSHLVDLPANLSKFTVKRDPVSNKYVAIASRLLDTAVAARNLLSLFVSDDLVSFKCVLDLIDRREEDKEKTGFQYVDFEIEGEDIIYLCRTAMNGAHNYHDANYQTFHRIKNFRSFLR